MEEKWHGIARSPKIPGVTPAQAWAILGDYYALHKAYPSAFHACSRGTHRCDGRPGSIRHTVMTMPGRGGQPPQCHWVKDRLVEMDSEGMKYTWEFVENSLGYGTFLCTLGVVPADQDGCVIEWSYECGPPVGWTYDELVSFMQNGVEEMAKVVKEKIEAAKPQ